MAVRHELDVEPGDNYKEFIEIVRRSLDPTSNTVLLVDDERGIRMKVARDVRRFDPTIVVHEASNGMEALEKLQHIRAKFRRDPLFIVLDLNMPVMDGWEVIKALKEDYQTQGKEQGIPIIVLSSTSGEKGGLFTRRTVHEGKTGYSPLVSIAKESCVDKTHYDATGEKSLMTWLKFFVDQS